MTAAEALAEVRGRIHDLPRRPDSPSWWIALPDVLAVISAVAAEAQADPQTPASLPTRRTDGCGSAQAGGPIPAAPEDGLPLPEFSEAAPNAIYRLTEEERPRVTPIGRYEPIRRGDIEPETRRHFVPLHDRPLPDGLGRD